LIHVVETNHSRGFIPMGSLMTSLRRRSVRRSATFRRGHDRLRIRPEITRKPTLSTSSQSKPVTNSLWHIRTTLRRRFRLTCGNLLSSKCFYCLPLRRWPNGFRSFLAASGKGKPAERPAETAVRARTARCCPSHRPGTSSYPFRWWFHSVDTPDATAVESPRPGVIARSYCQTGSLAVYDRVIHGESENRRTWRLSRWPVSRASDAAVPPFGLYIRPNYARVCSRRSRLPDAYRSVRNSTAANSQTTTSQSTIDWVPLPSMSGKRHWEYLISSTVSGTDTVSNCGLGPW